MSYQNNQTRNKKKAAKYKSTTVSLSKDSDLVFTSSVYAQTIDEQIVRYFYATNTPFNHVRHPEFIKFCSLLRPGYTPPSERRLAGELLDTLHKKSS